MFQRWVFEKFHDPGTAEVRIARDVEVIRPGIFQRKANELAAALDRRLIVQLITHGSPPQIRNGHREELPCQLPSERFERLERLERFEPAARSALLENIF